MSARKPLPRLVHREPDELTVFPSERSAGSELLASIRRTADVVAIGELQVAATVHLADVAELADVLKAAAKTTCVSCRNAEAQPQPRVHTHRRRDD